MQRTNFRCVSCLTNKDSTSSYTRRHCLWKWSGSAALALVGTWLVTQGVYFSCSPCAGQTSTLLVCTRLYSVFLHTQVILNICSLCMDVCVLLLVSSGKPLPLPPLSTVSLSGVCVRTSIYRRTSNNVINYHFIYFIFKN